MFLPFPSQTLDDKLTQFTWYRDVWLTIDHKHYDGVEDVKKLFNVHVQRGFQPIVKLERNADPNLKIMQKNMRYIDLMSTVSHDVFVTDRNVKNFGIFTGSNAKGVALVLLEGRRNPEAFDAKLVISM